MPIDVSPPTSGNLQGFQIAPVQSTDPLQTLAQMSQLRTQGMQQQEAQLGLQQKQMEMDSQKALLQAMVDGGGDPDKTQQNVMTNPQILPTHKLNFQNEMLGYAQKKLTLTADQRKLQDDENDHWAGLLIDAKDQDDVNTALATGLQQGYKPPGGMVDAQGNMTQFNDPQHIKAYANSLLALSKQDPQKLIQQQTQTSAAEQTKVSADVDKTMADTAETQLKTKQLQGQLDWLEGLTPKGLADYVGGSINKTKYPDLYARAFNDASNARAMKNPAAVQAAVDKYAAMASEQEKTVATETDPRVLKARTDQAVNIQRQVAPIKIQVGAAEAVAKADAAGLTPDDYNRAGEQYTRTGVMPALGRDSITRARIVQAGNQWARDNGLSPSDVVTMQAAYAGDKDSLKKFQSQRDQIVSFEQTAQKNLDMMLTAGKKLADTGSRWLNAPLRSINRNLLSTDEQAAFDAAQLIARNEVAKVTGGGGLGGVVSDSARGEMKDAMGSDPTISNMVAVANIMKQDMANRHGSMDATLSDIKSRIGGGGAQGGGGGQQGGPPPLQYVRTSTGANNHKIGQTADGKWHDVQTGAVIQ